MKCKCIVDSSPPSTVHFVLADIVLPSTQVESNGSLTIGTLQADLGQYKFVVCQANNTQGHAEFHIPLGRGIRFWNSPQCMFFLLLYMSKSCKLSVVPLNEKHVICFVFFCLGRWYASLPLHYHWSRCDSHSSDHHWIFYKMVSWDFNRFNRRHQWVMTHLMVRSAAFTRIYWQ